MIINKYSLEEISSLSPHKNDFFISIRDIGYVELYSALDKIPSKNILKLFFDDVTQDSLNRKVIPSYYKEVFSKRSPVLFDNSMRDSIFNFVSSIPDDSNLHIHCYAGKSRSVALLFALNQIFNLYIRDIKEDYRKNLLEVVECSPYDFNSQVYVIMLSKLKEI